MQDKNQPTLPRVGDLIKGKVISVSKSAVHMDIAGIATGVVRGKELIDESGDFSDLKLEEEAQATVMELENENGEIELSFRAAGHQKAWENLQKIMESEEIIQVPVTEANRGGLMVRVGRIDGFLPVSQLIPEHYPRVEGGDKNKILEILKNLIGKKLKVKLINVDESDNKLILSEKSAWEKEQKQVISNYKVGGVVDGKITGVVEFGAFIEFGEGLEGLIHISELAWQRIDDPKDIIKVGDKIKAKIISVEGTKISLSMKQLQDDPWKEVVKKYKIGQKVKGTIIKINPFGAFVELDKDIHGLVHISELSNKKINHPNEAVKEGDKVNLKILSIEPDNHRLGLSLKAVKETPEKEEKTAKEKEEKKKGSDSKKEKSEQDGSQSKDDQSPASPKDSGTKEVDEKSPQSGHRNQFNKSAGSRPREIPSAEKEKSKPKKETKSKKE